MVVTKNFLNLIFICYFFCVSSLQYKSNCKIDRARRRISKHRKTSICFVIIRKFLLLLLNAIYSMSHALATNIISKIITLCNNVALLCAGTGSHRCIVDNDEANMLVKPWYTTRIHWSWAFPAGHQKLCWAVMTG